MRTTRLLTPGLLAAALAVAGLATAGPAALPRPEIKEWKLDNGLDVIYVGVHKAPVVAVQVWYHAGSKDEPRTRRGSAHMFEHMMFKGTGRVPPEEHARLLDRLGGRVNAGTREDVTYYHQTLPKGYLDFAVMLEAERMRGLLFRPEMIKTEAQVVMEEIRQEENDPIQSAMRRFREIAFTRHPYAWGPGGDLQDLAATTPADLKKFYDTYYVPNNAVLIVVGDVAEEEVRAAADKHFGRIPRGAEPPRPAAKAQEPPQTAARREVQKKPAQIGVVIGGYHAPGARSEDVYALSVLASIMSDGDSSRLNVRVVRKDKIGVGAGMGYLPLEDSGIVYLAAAHLTAEQGPKCEAALLEEVERLRSEKVTAEELTKAKNNIAAAFVYGLQDVDGIAQQVGVSKLYKGDSRAWLDAYDKYLAVTADDVQRVARKYLSKENLTIVVVPPAAGEGGAP